jgi:hypothetical protein
VLGCDDRNRGRWQARLRLAPYADILGIRVHGGVNTTSMENFKQLFSDPIRFELELWNAIDARPVPLA